MDTCNKQTDSNSDENKTCFTIQKKYRVCCERKSCQHWINNPEGQNCVLISAHEGPHTLQKIGKIYDLSRMRIYQIEKLIFKKIKLLNA